MKQYITVSEFAAAAGVSRQAVYKRLADDLTRHSKRINGKWTIDRAAVVLFNHPKESAQPQEAEQCRTETDRIIERQREEIQALKQQVIMLQSLSIQQAKTIENLLNALGGPIAMM